jgi:hypothetical protein
MRYSPHATRDDRARQRPPLAAPLRGSRGPSNVTSPSTISVVSPTWFDRPLQAVELERLSHNATQVKWNGISLCKTGARGGGGCAWLTGDDSDA